MKCPECNTENRDDANFCTKCGTTLRYVCNRCYTPAQEGDIYCTNCGSKLTISTNVVYADISKENIISGSQQVKGSSENVNSERKNVTVLFADLTGFTAMSEKLDPEEVTTIMNTCLDIMGNSIQEYEGYIDKFIGDAVMAIFGAPITHENDPELAIRAALEMSRKVSEFNKTLPIKLEKPLSLHIGINTGLVIAGNMGSNNKMDYTVMGDTVNLSSRLESKASAGKIYISAYTYNLVKNLFEFIELEPIEVKGKKDPVSVYEVVRLLDDSEIKNVAQNELPLVGRVNEVNILAQSAHILEEGDGQVIFLVSDPGFGKSRVRNEAKKYFNEKIRDIEFIEGTCHSYAKHTPYKLFIDIFKKLCDISSDDLSDTMAQKLEETLIFLLHEDSSLLSEEIKEAIVFIGKLLDIDLEEQYNIAFSEMLPQEVSASTIRAISWVFATISQNRVIVLSLEDLQYADTASIEIIMSLINFAQDRKIVLILTLRPEKKSVASKLEPYARKILGDRVHMINFDRLTRKDSEELVKLILDVKELPKELIDFVGTRSNGNPLFIQEIVHSLINNGSIKVKDNVLEIKQNLSDIEIPDSINGLILARLDQLPKKSRELTIHASVIGPSFSKKLIENVMQNKNIDDEIDTLIESDIIFESQSFPDIEYTFHTTFIQEAIYETLLLKRRRGLHLSVANSLENMYTGRIKDFVEPLSRHYLEGNDLENAFKYFVQSALKCKANFSNDNAAKFFKKSIEIADSLNSVEPPIESLKEYYSEVLELQGELDDAISSWKNVIKSSDKALVKANALRNIGRIEEKRGAKNIALEMYEKAIELAKEFPDSLEFGLILMNHSWVLNRFRKSQEALDKAKSALKIFERLDEKEHIALCCNNIAVFYESLNELDEALDFNQRSISMFKELHNRRQLGNVELSMGYLLTKRGELDTALQHFNNSIESMQRIGNKVGSATAWLAKGRCYSDMKKYDEAELSMLTALKDFKEIGIGKKVIATEISLIKILIEKRDTESAYKHFENSMSIAQENSYDSDIGKLYGLKAELLIMDRDEKEALKMYKKAYDVFMKIGRQKDADNIEEKMKNLN